MELVTVIIPVYNVEKYIDECLRSILNQDYRPLQIIIVNDGSTDKSAEIIEKYVAQYNNILFIKQKNQGLSAARNKGLAHAKGKYITFVDSDDIIDKQMVSILMDEMAINRADIAYTSLKRFKISTQFSSNKIEYEKLVCHPQDALKHYFKLKSGNVCGGLFKSDLFNKVRFPKNMIFEDNLPKTKLLHQAKHTVFIDADLYGYRLRRNSITNEKFHVKKFDIVIMGYLIQNYLTVNDKRNCESYRDEYYTLFVNELYKVLQASKKAKNNNYERLFTYVPIRYMNKLMLLGLIRDNQKYSGLFIEVYPILVYNYLKFILKSL